MPRDTRAPKARPSLLRSKKAVFPVRKIACPFAACVFEIGVPRIELGLHAPHACVLPLYYTPCFELYHFTDYQTKKEGTIHAVRSLKIAQLSPAGMKNPPVLRKCPSVACQKVNPVPVQRFFAIRLDQLSVLSLWCPPIQFSSSEKNPLPFPLDFSFLAAFALRYTRNSDRRYGDW